LFCPTVPTKIPTGNYSVYKDKHREAAHSLIKEAAPANVCHVSLINGITFVDSFILLCVSPPLLR